MESMMPRLIHLLAHHPDFQAADRDNDDLVNFSIYFEFYFDAVVTAENLVIVYHYCQRIKQVVDAVLQDELNADVSAPLSESITTNVPFSCNLHANKLYRIFISYQISHR